MTCLNIAGEHDALCEGDFIDMTQAWRKEKFRVPYRNRTHDLPYHHVGALVITELQKLMESKVIYLNSYMTSVLHTARINTI